MNWQGIEIAADATHHIRDEVPLYDARFDEVLKFHAPGLAPVRRGAEAWHITADGAAAYARRFGRTFGFYEGLAAVAGDGGWHHIRPDGSELGPERFAWCGNFQEGRATIRFDDGTYAHVTPDGFPAYDARWCYAGDFRDGIAVVQAASGRSTHVDRHGHPIHDGWFLDLDVFHKRFARARDDDGWMHVDLRGRPVYTRRFAAVEPFYNGQARVERFDGGLEVIDEAGRAIVELRPALRSELAELSADMVGVWRTQTIRTAVKLGVFEALPGSSTAVASACGLDAGNTHRLLRALAEIHLTELVAGEWHATRRGGYLAAGHPRTLADAAEEYGHHLSRRWEALPEAVRKGEEWDAGDVFADVAADPDRISGHHRMLMSYALDDYADVPRALELRGDERVIDAGGGLGGLASLLMQSYPKIQVTVLDRPEVIERATDRPVAAGVTFRAADLFQPWRVKADAVVMSRVLHDWDDRRSVTLLRHARAALTPGARIFVVEMVIPEDGVAGSLCDLHLLVATGGRERTATEYAALLEDARFTFEGIRRIPALPSILVGVAR